MHTALVKSIILRIFYSLLSNFIAHMSSLLRLLGGGGDRCLVQGHHPLCVSVQDVLAQWPHGGLHLCLFACRRTGVLSTWHIHFGWTLYHFWWGLPLSECHFLQILSAPIWLPVWFLANITFHDQACLFCLCRDFVTSSHVSVPSRGGVGQCDQSPCSGLSHSIRVWCKYDLELFWVRFISLQASRWTSVGRLWFSRVQPQGWRQGNMLTQVICRLWVPPTSEMSTMIHPLMGTHSIRLEVPGHRPAFGLCTAACMHSCCTVPHSVLDDQP